MILDRREKPEAVHAALAKLAEQEPFALVIVDTLAAFFDGDNINDAVQGGEFMRRLRPLTQIAGLPSVIVAAHPTKNATEDALVPYGSGAILNEVDGNLTLWKKPETGLVSLHWQGKLRGLEFRAGPVPLRDNGLSRHPRRERARSAAADAAASVLSKPPTIASEAGSRHRPRALAGHDRRAERDAANMGQRHWPQRFCRKLQAATPQSRKACGSGFRSLDGDGEGPKSSSKRHLKSCSPPPPNKRPFLFGVFGPNKTPNTNKPKSLKILMFGPEHTNRTSLVLFGCSGVSLS